MKFLAVFVAIIAVGVAMPTATPVQSTWTLQELNAALQDPNTDAALIPYLEHALNQIMDALFAGMQIDSVAINFPVEEIAVEPVQVSPSPVAVAPSPAVDTSSPLVQIIINVNGQTSGIVVPSPVPALVPSPVAVPEVVPTPVIVVEEAFDALPVQVEEIAPEPVQVAEPAEVNPIDVIAVGAPEVNPIDLINPVLVNPAGVAVVGPIV